MKIGVDLRALQAGHQYRGIGEVVKRTLNEIFPLAQADSHEFVFFVYDKLNDPKDLLDVPKNLKYAEIVVGEPPEKAVRSKAKKVQDALVYLYGNPIKRAHACDIFLQYDYELGVPTDTKTVLVSHDIIPFIYWRQFFESPWTHVKNKAARTTLRTMFGNYRAVRALRRALKNADRIVTVSEHTRQDLREHFGTPLKKMTATALGVSQKVTKNTTDVDHAKKPTKPFLFFIGGVDKRRRRIDDIVAAFNNLKAEGHDIQLVLAGENFRSFEAIPKGPVRTAVQQSSYKHDIIPAGYVDDATKQYLFQHAIAFVFPSKYEGFGIPILEAMLHGCPVITYKNSAIPETGGEHAFYVDDWEGIFYETEHLLAMSHADKQKLASAAKEHTGKFTWDKTAKVIYQELQRTTAKR